jgi:hypothetical protein
LTYPSEKYYIYIVSWDYDIPIYGKIKNVPNISKPPTSLCWFGRKTKLHLIFIAQDGGGDSTSYNKNLGELDSA